jgi:(+)-trans-carveol dehydrogenase
MGTLEGRVIVISGAARGQGRAHAVRLAREGANIVAFDICAGFNYSTADAATEADPGETQRLVESEGQACLAAVIDARDLPALTKLADGTMARFGRLDAIVVNHGIWVVAPNSWELKEDSWQESIDVLLTGAWKVVKAFVPKIIQGGRGGSVILTSSSNATVPQPGAIAYCAAKAGLNSMARVLAWELGAHSIRVNALAVGGIDTPMTAENGALAQASKNWPQFFGEMRVVMPVGRLPPEAVSDAVRWLVSDEAAFVTGAVVPVDAGRAIY